MKLKSLPLIIFLLFTSILIYSQKISPIAQTSGHLEIRIDPRMELLCAVQLISDYPTINRNTPYSREIIEFFKKDTTQEAVKITKQLAVDYGFVHDAPLDLILRLSALPELKTSHPFTPRTIERAGNKTNLESYRKALKKFGAESQFTDFWNSHRTYYQKMVQYTVTELKGCDPVQTFNDYFNESKKSYTVILSNALMGGYGMRVADEMNELNIFACLNTDKENEGIPYYSKENLLNYLYHEFSHSFVNPLTDNYASLVDATASLFIPIQNEMRNVSCGRWITCINEHIVRALHIRILHTLGEKNAAESLLEMEHSRHFAYIDPILDQLEQFEQERDANNISFTQFYPQLMAVFDSLSHTDNTNLINPPFTGPVQLVLGQTNLAIIYPTNGSDSLSLNRIFEYTARIKSIKGDQAVLYADTTALKTDLSDASILAYGTIESNLFLKQNEKSFPFKISGDTLFTDTKLTGEKLRLITCLPNPQNKNRGMMINTATRNENLKSVMLKERADFLVFESIDSIIQQGFYKKGKDWIF